MARVFAIVLIGSLPFLTAQSEDRPGVTRTIDLTTGRETGKVSEAEVDQIVRFVKTIRGINHHVEEVDGTSPPQVLVHTGSRRALHGGLTAD